MAPSYYSYTDVPQSISFSGSGFLATYQLGVAQCFLTCAPWILHTAPRVLGASAGSLVAAAVVCDINPIAIRDEMIGFAKQLQTFTLGPLNPSINVFHWLEHVLYKYLPPNAHQMSSGRLAVAVTRLIDGQQIVLSEYHSKEDVVQALLCSCFVPGYCGFHPPTFQGVHYMDGGFSGMQPTMPLSSNRTLTVCPFSGDIDICPADPPCMMDLIATGVTLKGNMANSIRILNALYPLGLEPLEKAFHNGYKDAIQFLQCHDLARYCSLKKVLEEPQNYNQSPSEIQEEVLRAENDSAPDSSLDEHKPPQKVNTSEPVRGEYPSVRTTPLFSRVLNNAVVVNVVSCLSKFGLPAWLVTYLLLPFLLFYNMLQNGNRLEDLFQQMSDFMFWTWLNMRHCFFFFFTTVVSTITKNVKDRLMLVVLLLQWINVRTQYGTPRRHRRSQRSSWLSSRRTQQERAKMVHLLSTLRAHQAEM